jgi:hypothetical protein
VEGGHVDVGAARFVQSAIPAWPQPGNDRGELIAAEPMQLHLCARKFVRHGSKGACPRLVGEVDAAAGPQEAVPGQKGTEALVSG